MSRADKGMGRVSPELMAEAVRLRRAVPTRSAAQITDIIARAHGVLLSERTVRAHLARSGVSRRELTSEPARAFGRFEASRRNEIWIGDVLIGPFVPHPRRAGSRRAKLFLLVDDHSRLLVQGRWMEEENTRAGQDVLRAAICRRGVPENLYLDNGAPYRSSQLARTCAVLGVHLIALQALLILSYPANISLVVVVGLWILWIVWISNPLIPQGFPLVFHRFVLHY